MNNKTGVVCSLALFALGIVFSIYPMETFFAENGPFEMAQVLVMAGSTLIWANLALLSKRDERRSEPVHYTFAVFFAVLSLVVAARETSFLRIYGAGADTVNGLKLMTVLLCLPFLGGIGLVWLKRPRLYFRRALRFMASPTFRWCLVSLAFVVGGDIFEKKWLPIDSSLVWEETLELMGYFAMLSAGWITITGLRQTDVAAHKDTVASAHSAKEA
ncbi:hypothetical protein [Flexibacterium corallicola]|uniref:hypothetical protein n=1 Tax=Flexibacterium corallicola TaxID=3037259 RepID=UPI00286F6036|nr:hypothetical protein [Pseudovibrio sp. M1P-2-3]